MNTLQMCTGIWCGAKTSASFLLFFFVLLNFFFPVDSFFPHGKLVSLPRKFAFLRTVPIPVYFPVSKQRCGCQHWVLMSAQMLMRATAQAGCVNNVKESALEVTLGEKSLAAPGSQACISTALHRTLIHLSYFSTPRWGCSSVGKASDPHATDTGLIPQGGRGFFS